MVFILRSNENRVSFTSHSNAPNENMRRANQKTARTRLNSRPSHPQPTGLRETSRRSKIKERFADHPSRPKRKFGDKCETERANSIDHLAPG